MSDLPPDLLHLVAVRHDGPIPPQYLETELTRRRRQRGRISLLEIQASQFLDAAERCQQEQEDLAAELAEPNLASQRRGIGERKLEALRRRGVDHIHAAADALRRSAGLREVLGLDPQPLALLCRLLVEKDGGYSSR